MHVRDGGIRWRQWLHVAVLIILTAAIFALDVWAPLGVAVWLLYFIPMWYAMRFVRMGRLTVVTATAVGRRVHGIDCSRVLLFGARDRSTHRGCQSDRRGNTVVVCCPSSGVADQTESGLKRGRYGRSGKRSAIAAGA